MDHITTSHTHNQAFILLNFSYTNPSIHSMHARKCYNRRLLCYINKCARARVINMQASPTAHAHLLPFVCILLPRPCLGSEMMRSNIIEFIPRLETLLDGITAILRVAKQHLRARHIEHRVRDVGYDHKH
jgi:hypothetical protein